MKNLTVTIGLILLSLSTFSQSSNEMDLFIHKAVKAKNIVLDTANSNELEKTFFVSKEGMSFEILDDKIIIKKRGKKLVVPYGTNRVDVEGNTEHTFFYQSEDPTIKAVLYKRHEISEEGARTTYSFTIKNMTYDFVNFFSNGTPYKG